MANTLSKQKQIILVQLLTHKGDNKDYLVLLCYLINKVAGVAMRKGKRADAWALRCNCPSKGDNMNYFESNGFQKDFNNLLKSILLVSKRIEELTIEVRSIRESITVDPNKEKSTEFATPPKTML